MKKLVSLLAAAIAAALLCVASVSPSYAITATTVYVSGQAGANDTNACTLAAPCRTIGHALSVAVAGSTVSCLDAGPYTEFIGVMGSYTVDCRGVIYGIGSQFIFTIQSPGQMITFRHVVFDGVAGGVAAVRINGGTVTFENCTFQNFNSSPGEAVQLAPTAASAHLTIADSVFTNNGTGSGGGGIVIQPSGGVKATAVIERTQVANNTYGIVANASGGTVLVKVRNSSVANNLINGIWAFTTGSVSSIVVEHSASDQNGGSGIIAQGANAFVSLNDLSVTWNATGLNTVSDGLILSYNNNVIAGNLSPGVTPVSVNQQ